MLATLLVLRTWLQEPTTSGTCVPCGFSMGLLAKVVVVILFILSVYSSAS